MARCFWMVLGATLWSCLTYTRAQANPALSPVVPISERKVASLPKLAPASAGWKLLRSGVAPVGEGGRDVWIFAFGRAEPIPKGSLFDDLLNITLFVAEPIVSKSRQKRWRVLRRVPLGMRQASSGREFQLRWLKPVEKSGPVLIVPFPGLRRCELLAFPNGWQSAAVRQQFEDADNSIQGFRYSFDTLDEANVLAVVLRTTNYSDGNSSPGGTELLKWIGTGWGQQPQVLAAPNIPFRDRRAIGNTWRHQVLASDANRSRA